MSLSTLSITDQIQARIEAALPGAQVEASGSGGHFVISVVSEAFEGLNSLKKQRLVYSAIKDLMAGDSAPLHAVDTLITKTPAQAAG